MGATAWTLVLMPLTCRSGQGRGSAREEGGSGLLPRRKLDCLLIVAEAWPGQDFLLVPFFPITWGVQVSGLSMLGWGEGGIPQERTADLGAGGGAICSWVVGGQLLLYKSPPALRTHLPTSALGSQPILAQTGAAEWELRSPSLQDTP